MMKKFRLIERYSNFKDELLLEGIINESILYFSPRVKNILKNIDNDISNDLLSLYKTYIKPDVTFLDLDKEGYLSFTTMKSAIKNLITDLHGSEEYWSKEISEKTLDDLWRLHDMGSLPNDIYVKSRNSIKIGKLVNKISTKEYSDKEVEDFVNSFKAIIVHNQEKFEIIEGEKIAFWYNEENYVDNRGSLGSSCMSDMGKQIFDIYTKNPQVCRMLILRQGDKISGRALIWKIPNVLDGVEYFMDRQYTNKDSDVKKFRNFAKEQGNWISKSNNTHYSYKGVINHQDSDNILKINMEVQLSEYNGSYDYENYPYVDTFRRYDRVKGILYNDDGESFDGENNILLQDTDGDYEVLNSGKWSMYHDTYIPNGEEVYSEPYDDYLYRDQSVLISGYNPYLSYGWYNQDDDEIVCTNNNTYIHKNDAIYSNTNDEWYRKDESINVILDLTNDGDIVDDDNFHEDSNEIMDIDQNSKWYKYLSEKSSWDDFNYILKSLMIENYNSDYIPEVLEVNAFKLKKTSDIKFLTKLDAELLEIEIDNDVLIMDRYEYHLNIEKYLNKLYKLLLDKIKYLTSMINDKGQLRLKLDNDKEYLKILENKKYLLLDRLERLEKMIEVI